MQVNYVRVTIKGKVFQMALNDEVRTDECTSKRSQVTGHLLITLPKLNAKNVVSSTEINERQPNETRQKEEKLKTAVDIRNIVIDESEIPPLK